MRRGRKEKHEAGSIANLKDDGPFKEAKERVLTSKD